MSQTAAPLVLTAEDRAELARWSDIRDWIENWNASPRPFAWTKAADEILDSLAKYLARISGTGSDVDLRAGRTDDAAAHLREGLRLAARTGTWLQLLPYVHQCGDLCGATGRAAEALTLWAACAAVRLPEGHTYPLWFKTRREEQQRRARQALGSGRARAAEDRGAAMSLATAAEYALILTAPASQPATAAGTGQLSARERELVTLVAQGRTNAQIAAELHISIRTS